MKKLKLFVVALLVMLVSPLYVNAQSANAETTDETGTPITVHIFKGDGCPHCAEALEYFESIEEEYGYLYNLVEHEVWSNADNAELMTEVAEYFNEDLKMLGVPYIVIGDKTFVGYDSSFNILETIQNVYKSGEFVDMVEQIQNGTVTPKEKKNDNRTTIIIISVALIGFVALFYFAREPKEEKVAEETKKEVVKEEPKKAPAKKAAATKTTTAKKTTTPKKTTAAKKTTTTKKSTPAKKTTTAKKSTTKTSSAKKTTSNKTSKSKTTKK